MLSLNGNLDKKTKGMPRSFERLLNENTAILENLVTIRQIWGVLETKITPFAFQSLRTSSNGKKMKKKKGSAGQGRG